MEQQAEKIGPAFGNQRVTVHSKKKRFQYLTETASKLIVLSQTTSKRYSREKRLHQTVGNSNTGHNNRNHTHQLDQDVKRRA